MSFELLPMVVIALASIVLVSLFWWLWLQKQTQSSFLAGQQSRDAELAQSKVELVGLSTRFNALHEQTAILQTRLEQVSALQTQNGELEKLHEAARTAHTLAEKQVAELTVRLTEQRQQNEERVALLERVSEQMKASFSALAGDILEDKSKRFSEQNVKQIDGLLSPLREQIKDFHRVVSDSYVKESKERSLLAQEISALKTLNQKISEEAQNLTSALKGDNKAQGAWGELQLERLLEASGLQKGREFETQVSLKDGEGGRPKPDVIVRLPDGKDIVIDAKMALLAYERAYSASDESERKKYLAEHTAVVRRHVKQLSERDYSQAEGVNSLDFVLMFIPVEAAFIEAVRADDQIYDYALASNVVICSPSTLLAVLRTVSNLWRFDDRNRHAMEIADKSGALYDKFVGLVEDLQRVSKRIDETRGAMDDAFGKLSTGRGNLLRRVENIKRLGARAQKNLDGALVDQALESSDDE